MNARTRSRFSGTAAMIADMREALQAVLGPISEPVLLPGGASKEAWAVDAGGRRLLVYIEDLDGREAFVMERLEGETIGRRIVRSPVPERLPLQMAEELAKIHALPAER